MGLSTSLGALLRSAKFPRLMVFFDSGSDVNYGGPHKQASSNRGVTRSPFQPLLGSTHSYPRMAPFMLS